MGKETSNKYTSLTKKLSPKQIAAWTWAFIVANFSYEQHACEIAAKTAKVYGMVMKLFCSPE